MTCPGYSRAILLASIALAGCASSGERETVAFTMQPFNLNRDRQTIELAGSVTEAIALRPVDADARCMRVSAQFSNGDRWDMFIGERGNIRRGETRWMAVPRPWQNPLLRVMEIQVVCHPIGPGAVTMDALASGFAPT